MPCSVKAYCPRRELLSQEGAACAQPEPTRIPHNAIVAFELLPMFSVLCSENGFQGDHPSRSSSGPALSTRGTARHVLWVLATADRPHQQCAKLLGAHPPARMRV